MENVKLDQIGLAAVHWAEANRKLNAIASLRNRAMDEAVRQGHTLPTGHREPPCYRVRPKASWCAFCLPIGPHLLAEEGARKIVRERTVELFARIKDYENPELVA